MFHIFNNLNPGKSFGRIPLYFLQILVDQAVLTQIYFCRPYFVMILRKFELFRKEKTCSSRILYYILLLVNKKRFPYLNNAQESKQVSHAAII